ncbi:hypothetical protein LAZ67_1007028 [Cordylochernes scorpioides]|uniref:Major facilitator superfamily (MFS) profile domain-containing protein n=1 Tax=Cordylochernes scorpioides TaxID=51811 RepID=A0ABY6K201_9ARAC|nr:hypothetical protein LAZ67_1007028 [Cordylochernes scorpioides]
MEDEQKQREDDAPVPPPDGGWGWCVVAASFMCNAIVDGVIFSFGLFLLEFTSVMGVSKATTAWIGSLQAGSYLMVGGYLLWWWVSPGVILPKLVLWWWWWCGGGGYLQVWFDILVVMGISWCGSPQAGAVVVVVGIFSFQGPIVSALANQYGCRPVTIVGSVIACIAFVLSFFATNIVHLYLTFGLLSDFNISTKIRKTQFYIIIRPNGSLIEDFHEENNTVVSPCLQHRYSVGLIAGIRFKKLPHNKCDHLNLTSRMSDAGIGFGFIYLPAIVTVGYYFERRRALATGIAVCGSGVGTFILAPLVQYLLGLYGWRGSLLVLGGLSLHCAVFGAFFRPLESAQPPPEPFNDPEAGKPLLQRIKEAREMMSKWDSDESVTNSIRKQKSSRSCSLPVNGQLIATMPNGVSTSSNCPPPSYNEVMGNELLTYLKNNHNELRTVNDETKSELILNSHQRQQIRKRASSAAANRPFYRKDIFFSGSLIRIPEYRSQQDVPQIYRKSVTKIPNEDIEELQATKTCCFVKCSPAMTYTLSQMLDFSLLTSPTFLLLGISGFLALAGVFIPFIFLVDRAVLVGIPKEQAMLLLSVIGVTNTFGRVFCGYISDKPQVSALVINNCALIMGGVATAISPFFSSYIVLVIYGGVFGFSIACFAALRSVITVELLGLERLTNAFGLLLLFQGVATMVGSPVAGLFYDSTGSYDFSFYIAGGLIAVAGIMGFGLPPVSRWEKARQRNCEEIVLEEGA